VLLENEVIIRLTAFASVFALMALLEFLLPRRGLRFNRLLRWPANLGITLLNTVIVRLVFPLAAVEFALRREAEGVGLLNTAGIAMPLTICIAVVLLDLAIYAQHVVFHRVPLLWRFHRMHHTDNDIDVTTGARFHPVEILLSMLIKFAIIAAIGVPATAVLLFELILSSGALFNHANFALPATADRLLRLLIVTPDMHRVHHSVVVIETNSNYGFNLSIWDRLFGTYVAQPEQGHTSMTIGQPTTQTSDAQRIGTMLAQPFKHDQ
jgi:sterol desaturase/sphingolipid hydroxylase (fatty acid hydroxylase superfamily)